MFLLLNIWCSDLFLVTENTFGVLLFLASVIYSTFGVLLVLVIEHVSEVLLLILVLVIRIGLGSAVLVLVWLLRICLGFSCFWF